MKNMKTIRLSLGMTQAELAKKLNVSQSNIAMWESGVSTPSGDRLPKIADALNCSIDALYGREPPGAEQAS